jgi:hypothetical protein
MIFIGIKKRTLGLIALVVILCLVLVTIYSVVKIGQNESKYQSVLTMTQMFEDTYFIAYISEEEEARSEKPSIELFDISKGEVIKRMPLTSDIQNEVVNYVKTIKSLYTKVVPFPKKGYVIRIPFERPIKTNLKLLNEQGIKSLDSVFIIISEKEQPLILVLDNQRRPYFYTFNASIQPLLDYLGLKPEQTTMEETDEIDQTNETGEINQINETGEVQVEAPAKQ